MEKRLLDIHPIMDVEHDCILSKQGDVSLVFKASLPEIFTQSDEHLETIHQGLVKAIKVLPKDSVLHKQVWFINTKYRAAFEKPDTSFLTLSSERHFNERQFLNHDCYFILTRKAPGRRQSTSIFSTL